MRNTLETTLVPYAASNNIQIPNTKPSQREGFYFKSFTYPLY